MSSSLLTVTDEREQDIRSALDEFMLVSRASSGNCSLHIPDENSDEPGPLCSRAARRDYVPHSNHNQDWKRKPVAVYPPGHKDICRYCATEWER